MRRKGGNKFKIVKYRIKFLDFTLFIDYNINLLFI